MEDWLSIADFVREKHDPRKLPLRWESYRSVLNPNLVAEPRPYLEDAAERGQWFYDHHYGFYVHFCVEPRGVHPGAGIPEGATEPDHTLDGLLIAEADSKTQAHAFAVSKHVFDEQVEAGEFAALGVCGAASCSSLRNPGEPHCVEHENGAAH